MPNTDLLWSTAIVVGASSGLGEELAKVLAVGGVRVALVARRAEELERVAQDIHRRCPDTQVLVYAHDVREFEAVPALFQQICRDLGGLDLIVYAAGVMPRIQPDEYNFEADRQTVEVNLLGAIAWLNLAADRFGRAKAGTIVGISSCAGDRGRRGYPVYGATKAALNSYLESLRNRIGRYGVSVVTVKPGPMDTPMTRGLGKQPFLISAEAAARQVVQAARRRKHTVYVPSIWRPIMWVIRSIPSAIFKKRNI